MLGFVKTLLRVHSAKGRIEPCKRAVQSFSKNKMEDEATFCCCFSKSNFSSDENEIPVFSLRVAVVV